MAPGRSGGRIREASASEDHEGELALPASSRSILETQPDARKRGSFPRFARTPWPQGQPQDAITEAATGRSAVEVRERRYRRLLGWADAFAASLALLVCVAVLGDDRLLAGCLAVPPLVVAVAKIKGLYDRDELLVRKTTLDEAPQLFQLATLCTLIFWLGQSLLVGGNLSNIQVLVLWAVLFGTTVLFRAAARAVARRTTPSERILFVGDAASYARLRDKLDADEIRAELVGRMTLQRIGNNIPGRRADGEELGELISWADVHRVIIEPQVVSGDEMLDFVRAAKASGVRVSLLPRVLDVVGGSVVMDDLHGMTVMGVQRFGLSRSSLLLKRAFDLAGATMLLLVAGPLMAAIAVAIKLDSRGPVMFRQTRVGRNGKHFRISKFRTMCSDAEERKAELIEHNEIDGGLFKMADDPRVTRIGRLLRKTSLDELPQLFNIIAGDMSLVGPRPLIVDEDQQIKGWDRRRLQLTPGMTGHWQILGSARVPLHEMVKIDYLYVSTWSLWMDLKILLRTVPYVVSRRGM